MLFESDVVSEKKRYDFRVKLYVQKLKIGICDVSGLEFTYLHLQTLQTTSPEVGNTGKRAPQVVQKVVSTQLNNLA
jgi:hypothetical protein